MSTHYASAKRPRSEADSVSAAGMASNSIGLMLNETDTFSPPSSQAVTRSTLDETNTFGPPRRANSPSRHHITGLASASAKRPKLDADSKVLPTDSVSATRVALNTMAWMLNETNTFSPSSSQAVTRGTLGETNTFPPINKTNTFTPINKTNTSSPPSSRAGPSRDTMLMENQRKRKEAMMTDSGSAAGGVSNTTGLMLNETNTFSPSSSRVGTRSTLNEMGPPRSRAGTRSTLNEMGPPSSRAGTRSALNEMGPPSSRAGPSRNYMTDGKFAVGRASNAMAPMLSKTNTSGLPLPSWQAGPSWDIMLMENQRKREEAMMTDSKFAVGRASNAMALMLSKSNTSSLPSSQAGPSRNYMTDSRSAAGRALNAMAPMLNEMKTSSPPSSGASAGSTLNKTNTFGPSSSRGSTGSTLDKTNTFGPLRRRGSTGSTLDKTNTFGPLRRRGSTGSTLNKTNTLSPPRRRARRCWDDCTGLSSSASPPMITKPNSKRKRPLPEVYDVILRLDDGLDSRWMPRCLMLPIREDPDYGRQEIPLDAYDKSKMHVGDCARKLYEFGRPEIPLWAYDKSKMHVRDCARKLYDFGRPEFPPGARILHEFGCPEIPGKSTMHVGDCARKLYEFGCTEIPLCARDKSTMHVEDCALHLHTLQEMKVIWLSARDCKLRNRDENAWCTDVVQPLMKLAMRLEGKNKFQLQSVQSQDMASEFLPSNPAASSKFALVDRKATFTLSFSNMPSSGFKDLYNRLEAAGESVVSHMADEFTKTTALFSCVQVKRDKGKSEKGDGAEAVHQASIWMAASLRKKWQLARRVGLADKRVLVEPYFAVVGRELHTYFGYMVPEEGDTVHILGPERGAIGRCELGSIHGLFLTLRLFKNVIRYGRDEGDEGFWGGFMGPVLQRLAEKGV